jgi:hypothetical protein
MIRIKLAMVAVMLTAGLAAKGEAILQWFQGGSCGDSTNTALPLLVKQQQSLAIGSTTCTSTAAATAQPS